MSTEKEEKQPMLFIPYEGHLKKNKSCHLIEYDEGVKFLEQYIKIYDEDIAKILQKLNNKKKLVKSMKITLDKLKKK